MIKPREFKKKYPENYQVSANEWMPQIRPERVINKTTWQCCDCGLVHNVVFELITSSLSCKMTRNKKMTKEARKNVK